MKIHKVYIEKFKNLKQLTVDFNSESTVNVLIGKNGSGKSNLFEAIIEIFLFILEDKDSIFDFEIEYEINGKLVKLKSKDSTLYRDEKVLKRRPKEIFPETLVLYYSGHNERMMKYVLDYEIEYKGDKKNRLNSEKRELRNVFGVSHLHSKILSLLILLLPEDNQTKLEILRKLDLKDVLINGKLTLKKPNFYRGIKLEAMTIVENNSPLWGTKGRPKEDLAFWDVKGSIKEFLYYLNQGNKGNTSDGSEGFFQQEQKYYITLDEMFLKSYARNKSLFSLFEILDDLRIADMIDSLNYKVVKNNGDEIDFDRLSEGEIQSILFSSMIEIFKEKECLMLMDEPDAFLHPEWQINLIEDINRLEGVKNHVLMTSHNASTIVKNKGRIHYFSYNESQNKIAHNKVVNKTAIEKLSAGIISLNEQEEFLVILNKIRTESKPILFVEGSTDVLILRQAWEKLEIADEMPFMIMNALSCEFLHRILIDNKIQNEHSHSKLIGIFDFDEAYNKWNSISKEELFSNPNEGLVKKIKDKEVYGILLPVPSNERIRKQVIKDEGTLDTFRYESRLSIELLLFGYTETSSFFMEETCVGGKKIVFNTSNKIYFAEKIVPNLPKKNFENFKPLFTTIEKIIRGEI